VGNGALAGARARLLRDGQSVVVTEDSVTGRLTGLRSQLLRRFWDAHSDGWNEMRSAPTSRAHIATVVEMFTERLPPGAIVGDLGCGAGHYAVEIAARGYRVVGVDYSAAMLALARKHAADAGVTLDLRECDLDLAFPFEEGKVDAAILVSVLQAAKDPIDLLARVRHGLSPGGHLLIESVRKFGALSQGKQLGVRDRVINAAKKAVVKIPGLMKLLKPDDIAALCRSTGFEVVESHTYVATFVIVARKLAVRSGTG
jgi:SAM-dependent methyltransferase